MARAAVTDDVRRYAFRFCIVASSDLANHLGPVDYLVIVAPLTGQTRGLVNAELFRAMKPTAYLINVGRGPCCVVEADLLAAVGATARG